MTTVKVRRLPTDPGKLTLGQLLAVHERMFGPLTPQARARLTAAAAAEEAAPGWPGMDGLAV
ncbi:MAG TPA: hypothetical protein VFL90_22020 [Methylomirabilota bacterium]|nr:hypothetical protein [Methylomirabilota bacterium]